MSLSDDVSWAPAFNNTSEEVWQMRNTLSVLEKVGWKDLKYFAEDWSDKTYSNNG